MPPFALMSSTIICAVFSSGAPRNAAGPVTAKIAPILRGSAAFAGVAAGAGAAAAAFTGSAAGAGAGVAAGFAGFASFAAKDKLHIINTVAATIAVHERLVILYLLLRFGKKGY
jgi:hypothetical protein